jgi:hypothetical protein
MTDRYFYIVDLRLVGKIIEDTAYLYKNKIWVKDKESLLKNRLNGYCVITKTYHNKYMTKKIEEVSISQATHLMNLTR